jgi:hypothetical protein
MNRALLPWLQEDLTEIVDVVDDIAENLTKVGICWDRAREKPDNIFVSKLECVYKYLINHKWVFIISNSSLFLNTVALYIPAIYAINTSHAAFYIHTDDIIRMYNKFNAFGVSQSLEARKNIFTNAGLILYPHVNIPHKDLEQVWSQLNWWLNKRAENTSFHMLFTAFSPTDVSKNNVSAVIREVEKALGKANAAILSEKCEFIYMPFQIEGTHFHVER